MSAEEKFFTLRAVTKFEELERDGRGPKVSSVSRWLRHGVNGHILESRKVGGLRVVSREAVARWLKAIAGDDAAKAGHTAVAGPVDASPA